MNIIKQTSNILYASSISSIGFGFGRDIYKNLKKNWWIILIIISAIFSIFMLFVIGLWLGRNYKNILISLIKKTLAISILPFFYILNILIINFIIMFTDKLFFSNSLNSELLSKNSLLLSIKKYFYQPTTIFFQENSFTSVYFNEYRFLIDTNYTDLSNFVIFIFISVGLFVGFIQRKKRKLMWQAEDHNVNFMNKIEFSEIEKNTYRDKDFQEYRLDNVSKDYLEFMPEGKRGKRAFISIDNQGCYKEWSGIIKIDEKAKFLKDSLQQ